MKGRQRSAIVSIINCVRCGVVFAPDKNTKICPECTLKEQQDLKAVVEYLRTFPLANIQEVADKTGVEALQILRFVRQGSLILTEPPESLKCRLCGKDLKKGTLCQDCIDKVNDLKETQKQKEREKRKREFRRNR